MLRKGPGFTAVAVATLALGIGALDPATLVSVPLLLIAVGLLASYLPARQASALEPLVALRCD